MVKAFPTLDERYQYAENIIQGKIFFTGMQRFDYLKEHTFLFDQDYKPEWKFTAFKFGKPDLPKNRIWDKPVVWLREGLR